MKDKDKTLNSIQDANRKAILFILLGVFLIIALSITVYIYFFSSKLKNYENGAIYFSILLVDDSKPYGAFLGVISSADNRIGFIGIPSDMGLLNKNYSSPITMEGHYKEGKSRQVFDSIENTFDKRIDYRVTLNNDAIANVIDIIGGVRMFMEKPINFKDTKNDYILNVPIGEYLFTSEKIISYINYKTIKNFESRETLFRLEDVLINALISFIQDPSKKEKIMSRNLQNKISSNVKSNLRRADLIEIARILSNSDERSFIVESMDGSYDENLNILMPILEGRAAQKQLDNMTEYIELKTERSKLNNENVNLLILNATDIGGLADSINIRMRYKGFLAGEYGNFNTKLNKSVIFVRGGQIEKAFLVSKESRIDKVYASTDRSVLNDAVMALGYDYYEIKR